MSTPAEMAPTRVRRHRRVAQVVIAAIAVVLGVGQAIVWSRLAPGQQVMVYADGSYLSLPTADYHPFDGLALAVLAGAAIGLIVAAGAWQVRAIRGVATLGFVAVGTAVGSAIAYGLGTLMVSGVDPATVGSTGSASVVVAAATMGTPLVIIVEPLLAVATYTFLAAWDGRSDLGSTRVTHTPPLQPEAGVAQVEIDAPTEVRPSDYSASPTSEPSP